ncbi:TetR/AcrR family transcriptional regulator [Pararhizobium sp. PWRC1-1]|uniref:TetR/AcrR family transcriptional regulator n=1 Tax=Pararhizobium sp. PWRC1-1 TaxID=2804566 RepID=UPI003CEFAABA
MTDIQNHSHANAEPKPYHHGNLVEALVSATVAIIAERGVEHVSVREAAKRAGVSPAAPFRHFKTKTALMTAVAEQAMSRLKSAVSDALAEHTGQDPLEAFEAIGRGYLRWALSNTTHFEIISSRTLIDFNSSESLRRDNEEIRLLMIDLLGRAQESGLLREGLDFDHLVLGARALVYGLARMAVDGHMPEWHQTKSPINAVQLSMGLYISQIRAR